jgi:hypothetical protein
MVLVGSLRRSPGSGTRAAAGLFASGATRQAAAASELGVKDAPERAELGWGVASLRVSR